MGGRRAKREPGDFLTRAAEGTDAQTGDVRLVGKVSIVVPMLNEARHVEALVADIAAQDFPGEIEVLVADGGSADGSVELLRLAAIRKRLDLTLVDNPAGWVSQGLNSCIRRASGDLIVRFDCHARYPTDYVRLAAELATTTDAWNVGGIVVPVGRTRGERAVAHAMSSPFGGISWTRRASSQTPVGVDTVTYGAFKPEAFARAGLFDESLRRNQDDEFNARLRRAGGTILLDPRMRVHYTPRGSLAGVLRQYYDYGLWKVPVMRTHGRFLSVRSAAPLAFVGSLSLLGLVATRSRRSRRMLAFGLAAYALACVGFAASAVRRRGDDLKLVPRVAAVFPMFHIGYGTGMARGLLRAPRRR